MSPKLTVLIPVKNERRNIRACIESVRSVADEILVADSGSEDETKTIVREMGGCRLIEREFINYANFKNWALDHASHPWVLIVDADERVTPELAREIRRILPTIPDTIDGYWIYRKTYFMGHEIRFGDLASDRTFRLFRSDRCRYEPGLVHEQIHRPRARVRHLKHRLLHYSYWTYDQMLAKQLRYTQLRATEMWNEGRRVSYSNLLWRPFLRFIGLYIFRLGFLDGLPGLQSCMFQSFFVSYLKQARLWEMEYAHPQPDPEAARGARAA